MSNTKYHRLNMAEREEISRYLLADLSLRAISRILGRNPTTICNEINQPYFGRKRYRAHVAERRAVRRRRRQGRKRKLEKYPQLKYYVLNKLWLYWSPEQITAKLRQDYPHDLTMRISPETIYAYVYVQPKGELKRRLIKALRRAHKRRYRKHHQNHRPIRNIPGLVSIDDRPKEVDSRKVPGHWEGDLLIGKRKQSALGSLVERTSRVVILAPLTAFDHETVAKIFAREMQHLPQQMKKTMTYDRGGEMSSHQLFTRKTKIKVYFAHSKSPWERGTNENTNGLIRQFFPKRTDFRKVSRREIKRAQRLLNDRPRKTLNFQTPKEVFNRLVLR